MNLKLAALAAGAILAVGAPASAGDCHKVAGRQIEQVVSTFLSTGDPFGRVVTNTEGAINAVGTAVLTSVAPGPGGPPAWNATTRHAFVVNPNDQLVATGVAAITPAPNSTTDANDTVTLTVNGAESLGKFAGASGTIVMKGVGYNFYGPAFPFPAPAAGSAYFVFHYAGEICLAD